jgi:hypothetical protein
LIDPSLNARSVRASAGTSLLFTLATVGADDACVQLTTTVLSLSVKVTEVAVVVRAHPSGVEIVKPPAFAVKGTKAALSGISPGGLLSTGTGDSVGTADSDEPPGEAPPEAGEVLPAGPVGSEPFADPPPQAASIIDAASPIPIAIVRGLIRIVPSSVESSSSSGVRPPS